MLESSRSELVLIASTVKESMSRKSSQYIIPWQWFDIEGEVHIFTQYFDGKPKSVQKTLTCPTKDNWRKTMEEELEWMWKNQV